MKIIDGRTISFFLLGFFAEKFLDYGKDILASRLSEVARTNYQEYLLNTVGNEPYQSYKHAYELLLEMRHDEEKFKNDKTKVERMQVLMQKASDGGIPQAQYWLARIYCGGFGIEKNSGLAFYYIQKASENNLPNAKKLESNPCLN